MLFTEEKQNKIYLIGVAVCFVLTLILVFREVNKIKKYNHEDHFTDISYGEMFFLISVFVAVSLSSWIGVIPMTLSIIDDIIHRIKKRVKQQP